MDMERYFVVENAVRLKDRIDFLLKEGVKREDIYLFARYEDRAEDIANTLHISQAGVSEQGVVQSVKNLFTSRDDELRAQMMSLGLSEEEAKRLDAPLDEGKLVAIIKHLI